VARCNTLADGSSMLIPLITARCLCKHVNTSHSCSTLHEHKYAFHHRRTLLVQARNDTVHKCSTLLAHVCKYLSQMQYIACAGMQIPFTTTARCTTAAQIPNHEAQASDCLPQQQLRYPTMKRRQATASHNSSSDTNRETQASDCLL
jgi:hypothetical protein